MSYNQYLVDNLFGYKTAVLDSSYVVFNLYLHKLSKSSREAKRGGSASADASDNRGAQAAAPLLESSSAALGATATSVVSEASSAGSRADTISQVLCPFVESIIQFEQLPLFDALGLAPQAAAQRASRVRFLRTVYANPLPEEAAAVLDASIACGTACRSVFQCVGSSNGICATQPTARSAQIVAQGETRRLLAAVKDAKKQLERALNALTEERLDDDHEGGREGGEDAISGKLYDLCTTLYDDHMLPRLSICEVLCAVRSALIVRTEEAVELATRALHHAMPLKHQQLDGTSSRHHSPPPIQARHSSFRSMVGRGGAPLPSKEEQSVRTWFRSQLREAGHCPLADISGQLLNGSPAGATLDALPNKALAAFCALPPATLRVVHVLVSELPPLSLLHLDGLHELGALLRFLQRDRSTDSLDGFTQAADDACDMLLQCGLHDAEAWMEPQVRSVVALLEASSPIVGSAQVVTRQGSFATKNAPLTASAEVDDGDPPSLGASSARLLGRSGSHSNGGLSRTHSASLLTSRSGVSEREQPKNVTSLLAELQSVCDDAVLAPCDDIGHHVALLYDTLGKLNLFLKRMGLAHEVKLATTTSAHGPTKVVSTVTSPGAAGGGVPDAYLPHTPDESLGFNSDASELYTRACLLHRELTEQQRLTDRLDVLSQMADEDFFKEAHISGDLLGSLLDKANEHCVVTSARALVEKRLSTLLAVRVKMSHHSGEVRVVTVEQTLPFEQMLDTFAGFWPSIHELCDVTHVDEGDKILISTNREYNDLLAYRRTQVIDGMYQSGTLAGSQTFGRSFSGTPSSGSAMKLELFADPKKLHPPTLRKQPPSQQFAGGEPPASEVPKRSSIVREHRRLVDAVPQDMSINDYIRTLDAPPAQREPTMDELQRQYDRRAVAMGIPPPPARQLPTVENPAQPIKTPSSARQMFLAMGRAKRDATPATTASPLEPPARRWGVPKSTNNPSTFDFAQHSFKGEESFLKSTAPRNGDEELLSNQPKWNTPVFKQVQTTTSHPLREPQRISGPSRRSGVPLPKEARK